MEKNEYKSSFVKDFWEKKITHWEEGRYIDKMDSADSPMEKLADKLSTSLRFRLRPAFCIIAPHVKDKKIVDLGCGSGFLARYFIESGAKSYYGVDISEKAIQRGNDYIKSIGLRGKVTLVAKDLDEIDSFDADIVFSLGLLDWLPDSKLEKVYQLNGNAEYLHAISEDRISIQKYVHQIYCFLSYGFKSNGYVPRYFSEKKMKNLHDRFSPDKHFEMFRDARLSFGAYATTFKVPKELEIKEFDFKEQV